MGFRFELVTVFPIRQEVVARVYVNNKIAGDLKLHLSEWEALRHLLGSGAIEAATAGILCEVSN